MVVICVAKLINYLLPTTIVSSRDYLKFCSFLLVFDEFHLEAASSRSLRSEIKQKAVHELATGEAISSRNNHKK